MRCGSAASSLPLPLPLPAARASGAHATIPATMMTAPRRDIRAKRTTRSLALALAALAHRRGGGGAWALGPGSKFRFGHLQLGASSNPRPNALRRLLWEIEKRTAIEVDLESPMVTPTSPDLHETPVLYLAGD